MRVDVRGVGQFWLLVWVGWKYGGVWTAGSIVVCLVICSCLEEEELRPYGKDHLPALRWR